MLIIKKLDHTDFLKRLKPLQFCSKDKTQQHEIFQAAQSIFKRKNWTTLLQTTNNENRQENSHY
jgi:hypothetical protein